MKTRVILCPFALFLITALALPACKKEIPEHERQQKRQEVLRKKRKKLMSEGKIKSWIEAPHADDEKHEHQHGQKAPPRPLPLEDLDDSKWSKEIKVLVLRVKRAMGPAVGGLSLKLVQQGPAAFEAMRFLIRQRRQPKHKLAMLAMLLAEAQMFRPAELAKLGAEPLLPYLQRAAIQRLAWLKDEASQTLLMALKLSEKPMTEFIDQANRQRGVTYTTAQLSTLDAVLHGKDPAAVVKSLLTINDFSVEQGLFAIMHAKGTRRFVKALVAKRLVLMASAGDRQRLREYVQVRSHLPLIRVAAAQNLATSKDKEDQALLKKLAGDAKDPMAPHLRRLLAGEAPKAK